MDLLRRQGTYCAIQNPGEVVPEAFHPSESHAICDKMHHTRNEDLYVLQVLWSAAQQSSYIKLGRDFVVDNKFKQF